MELIYLQLLTVSTQRLKLESQISNVMEYRMTTDFSMSSTPSL
ncbi:uncharacterized protein METZ01_LOCUS392375 [marine metagenome]|uniref:Uncharacterized protein n=1 Tax=marine metagenome TaxID=408172 RepID=A0A382V0T2_9ZZZZ